MGIIKMLSGMFRSNLNDNEEERIMLDVDEEGRELYKDDIIAFVKDELEKRKNERHPLELQWILNSNFLVGNQYCDINPALEEIQQQEAVFPSLERNTFNQIAPLIETRIANLKKINYAMKVNPRTSELDDYAKAEVSTTLLRHLQDTTDFERKKNNAIHWNELCGSCFFLSWWDVSKGAEYAREKVIVTKNDGNSFERDIAYYEGDVDYGLISPYEVYPESIYKETIAEQRSIIISQVKTVEDIYDLYGIWVKGTSVETFELTPISSGGGFGYKNAVMSINHRTVENSARLTTYFERPSRRYPDGRLIITVNDEELIYYGDLPYSRIPLVQMVCREVSGQFFGKSVIEDLIPRQKAYNGCLNRIHEYIKRVAIQGHYVEEDSVIDIDFYEENGVEPGALVVYKRGSNAPIPIPNGTLPQEIMIERQNLKSDMEYVAGTSQLMVNGATPSGVTSGTAIENLQEIDNTRMSLTGDHIRNAVKDLAVLWLEILKKYARSKRVVQSVGLNSIGAAIVWSSEDINSFDVEYTTENELVTSQEAQNQRFFDMFKAGMFTDENGRVPERVKQKAIELSKMGNYTELLSLNTLHIQAAQAENAMFGQGVIPEVSQFDNHRIHYEEHLRYILQMDFKILKKRKPEYAKALEEHALMHDMEVKREEKEKLQQNMSGGQQI